MDQAIKVSRQEFDSKGKRDMELALEESLKDLNFKEGDSEETVNKKVKKASFEKYEIVINIILKLILLILLERNRG
jgi:hypothetical protein